MAATSYKLEIQAVGTSSFKAELVQGTPYVLQDNGASLLIKDIKYNAQMYCPNSIDVVVNTIGLDLETYTDITLSLYKLNNNKNDYLAKNYYVVEKKFKVTAAESNQKEYTLKAYSADYFLAIDKFCQAFTGKTLIDGIISPTLTNSISKNFNLFRKLTGSTPSENIVENLQNFLKDSIIPYAVQYNESFYDFMVRMCNRGGEFLYFGADNKLHIGLAKYSFSLDNKNVTEAEYIQTYNKEDKTNWIEPDYLGRFKTTGLLEITDADSNDEKKRKKEENKKQIEKFDYIKTFNEPISNEESNLYSNCYVLAPEYLEDLKQNSEYRGEYATKDDYFAWFSEITTAIRTFAVEGQISDCVASIANFEADRWIHINHWIKGINDSFDDKFKYIYRNNNTDIERTYLYADNTRNNKNYQDIYNKLETYQTSQLKLKLTGDNLPNVGDLVVWNDKCYVVYNIEASFLSTDNGTYSQGYEMLLLQCTENPQKASDYIFYPLPMPEKRYCKSSAQRAKVMDNFDPSRLGRVRVKFPWQKDTDITQDKDKKINEDNNWTPWIRVATPMASDGAGFLFTPAIGDEVLVDFEGGNIECPYVIGAFYNESHRPSVASQSQTHGKVKSITSANGHHISFTDNGGVERYISNFLPLAKFVTSFGDSDKNLFNGDNAKYFGGGFEISDYYGIYSITGSTHNRSIDISSPYGKVSIDAFQGITINAPLGDVKIVGKNVSIEARNNLTLESGTNIKHSYKKYISESKKETFLNVLSDISMGLLIDNCLGGVTGGVDMSFLRNYLEVLLRPIGGTMLIKSNRYMRLEAGEGKALLDDSLKGISSNMLIPHTRYSLLESAKDEVLRYYNNYKGWCESYTSLVGTINRFKVLYALPDLSFLEANGDIKSEAQLIEGVGITERNMIIDYRTTLEELQKSKEDLQKTSIEGFPKIDDIWRNFREINVNNIMPIKREMAYKYLKKVAEKDVTLNAYLKIKDLPETGLPADIDAFITNKDLSTNEALEKQFAKFGGVAGFINLSDDRSWGKNDKGAILFSDSKKKFFKIGDDGQLIKGENFDYRDDFIEIVNSVEN